MLRPRISRNHANKKIVLCHNVMSRPCFKLSWIKRKQLINDLKKRSWILRHICFATCPPVRFTADWHQATAWCDLLKRITADGLKYGMLRLRTCLIFTVFGLRVQLRLWCQWLSLHSLKTQSISPRNTRKRQPQCWRVSCPLVLEVDKCHVGLPAH